MVSSSITLSQTFILAYALIITVALILWIVHEWNSEDTTIPCYVFWVLLNIKYLLGTRKIDFKVII